MKRGKRQVVDLEPQPLQPQSALFLFQNPNINSHYIQITNSQYEQQPAVQNKPLETSKLSEPSLNESKPITEDADQKRKKIELLKQKYLKKSKPQQTKPTSVIQESQIPPNHHINTQLKPITAEVPQKPQLKNTPLQTKINLIQPPKNHNPIQNHSNQSQIKQQPKPSPIEQHKTVSQQENTANSKSSNINQFIENDNQLIEDKQTQISQIHEVTKLPTKIQGRNPPPPPPIKKPLPPPTIPSIQNSGQINSSTPKTEDELNKKTVPLPIKQQLIKEVAESNQKTERSDNISFAPPSLEGNEGNRTDKKSSQTVPPSPPVNRNMKQFLNKKLSSQKIIPKPPARVQSVETDEFNSDKNENNQTSLKDSSNNEMGKKDQVHGQIDDEYNGIQLGNKGKRRNKEEQIVKIDGNKFVGEWLGSPELTLKELFPELRQTIQFYCLNKNLTLKITSNNPAFTPLIAEFIQSFILNNSMKYTSDQKRVTESICLNFFYSNATEFTDIFLVLLIKTGEGYLQKYQKALEDKLTNYLSKILFYKNLFLPQEISDFVNFCIQSNLVIQNNFLQFLMLTDNAQLLTLVNNTEIQHLNNKLGLLSFCKYNIKSKSLIPLQLKLISSIEVELARNGLIQKILNHLKELDIPQNWYQYAKQLKLKLLKNYENNSQSQTNNLSKAQNSNQAGSNEGSKDSGLFGYFNLNKAIDKIKTSTEKALGAVQKPKKAQQEEKKDQIVYDPIRKRYIINGQIPEDDNGPQEALLSQVKPKVPPPPPLGGARKAPPPIHSKKPGPRIAVNRYV